MKLWSVMGNSQRLDGGAMFGNAPKAVWQKWIPADAANAIPLACRALLADGLAGKTVLFETGIGAFFEPKLRERFGIVESEHVLLQSLREAGFEHADIDVVVLSHLHFDHAGGLLAAWQEGQPPSLLFPNATFVVGAEHWQRALHPHPRDRASFIAELPQLLLDSGRLQEEFAKRHIRWERRHPEAAADADAKTEAAYAQAAAEAAAAGGESAGTGDGGVSTAIRVNRRAR